jgi:2'-5' RNA ligase
MPNDRIRAFLALPTPDGLKESLAALMRDLSPRLPGLRFVRPEAVHLTLRFLGTTTAEQRRAFEEHVRPAAAACPRGEGQVGGLGVFPDRGSPHVLFIGLRLPETVLALQRECEAAARASGLPPEERPFRPHLTLGRFRDRVRRPELPPAELGPLVIDELVLYGSDLRPEGAVHTPLTRFPLAR